MLYRGTRTETERTIRRAALVLAGALLVAAVAFLSQRADAGDDPAARAAARPAIRELGRLERSLDVALGETVILQAELARRDSVFRYSARYRVPADLAALIYDIALAEGLDPELGFRLVRAESGFDQRAVSPAGAVGLAQVLPATGRLFIPGITAAQLQRPEVNLRIGFRLLSQLLDRYRGDLRLALVAYNGGPGRVPEFVTSGNDSLLEYTRRVMRR